MLEVVELKINGTNFAGKQVHRKTVLINIDRVRERLAGKCFFPAALAETLTELVENVDNGNSNVELATQEIGGSLIGYPSTLRKLSATPAEADAAADIGEMYWYQQTVTMK